MYARDAPNINGTSQYDCVDFDTNEYMNIDTNSEHVNENIHRLV